MSTTRSMDDIALEQEWETMHVGRSWTGHALEDDCPCPHGSFGLVQSNKRDPNCQQHALSACKTIRQSHTAAKCPGEA